MTEYTLTGDYQLACNVCGEKLTMEKGYSLTSGADGSGAYCSDHAPGRTWENPLRRCQRILSGMGLLA